MASGNFINFKVGPLPSKKVWLISLEESPLKMVKDDFFNSS